MSVSNGEWKVSCDIISSLFVGSPQSELHDQPILRIAFMMFDVHQELLNIPLDKGGVFVHKRVKK